MCCCAAASSSAASPPAPSRACPPRRCSAPCTCSRSSATGSPSGRSRSSADLPQSLRLFHKAGVVLSRGKVDYSGGVVIRRTKIVATLGPATGADERIAALIEAGVNVVRVNASHGTADVRGPRVWARVVDGGTLTAHKGMNLPGLQVSAPALTEKDREDVADAVQWGVDYLALSFVRRAEDMAELRNLVPPAVKLVAKIEKATALDDLERILRTSDAVM